MTKQEQIEELEDEIAEHQRLLATLRKQPISKLDEKRIRIKELKDTINYYKDDLKDLKEDRLGEEKDFIQRLKYIDNDIAKTEKEILKYTNKLKELQNG